MDPDVVRLYSSSPPPLDEGDEEEDEDDFGDFGVYCCGVSSSFSFSELETSSTSGQSNEADTPGLTMTETEKLVLTGVPSPEVFSRGDHGLSSFSEFQHIRLYADPEPDTPSDTRSICTQNILTSGTDFVAGTTVHEAGQSMSMKQVLKSGKTVGKEERTEIKNEGLSNKIRARQGEKEQVQVQYGLEDPTELCDRPLDQSVKDYFVVEDTEKSEEPGIQADSTKAFNEYKDSTLHPVVEENMAFFCEGQITKNIEESARSPTALTAEMAMEEQFEESTVICTVETVESNSVDSKGAQDAFTQGSFCEESCTDASENVSKMNPTSAMSPPTEERFKETAGAYRVEPDELDSKGTRGLGDLTGSTQGGFADLVTVPACRSTDDEFAETEPPKDLKDGDEDEEPPGDDEDGLFSDLPLSESFADFSSAPFGGLAGPDQECWSAFGQQEEFGGQKETWAFREEKQSEPPELVLDLLENVFFFEITPEDPEVLTLRTTLELSDPKELRESVMLWNHLLDVHGAHGLKVQWVGSRSNRLLLDCLGMHNILFTGQNKQPVIIPMFAAGLGMLEPTKDPVKPSAVFSSSSPCRGRSTLCTQQVGASLNFYQDVLWYDPVDGRLCVPYAETSDDTIAHLNLDFFGPLEDSSSDSDTDTASPAMDPDLYELTTAGMDYSTSTADAFTRLMESIEKNKTVTRRPEIDEHTSEEAVQVLSVLPDLSFMKARVLMFPSILTPTLSHL